MALPQNVLQTISMITTDGLAVLSNNLQFTKTIARDWDNDFAVKNAKIGSAINIRRPAKYTTRTGVVVDIQAQIETYSPLTFGQPIGVDLAFTLPELLFSVDDIRTRVAVPAATKIANTIESTNISSNLAYVYNFVGTPGTPPTDPLDLVSQAQMLEYQNLAPVGDGMLHELNDYKFNRALVKSDRTLFNPVSIIGETYIKGAQGEYADTQHYISQIIAGMPQRTGTIVATGDATVTSTPSNPTESQYPLIGQLAVTNTSGHEPNPGDVFTMPGIEAVNPQTLQSYSVDQQFVVQAVSGSGTSWTWTISPALVASGPFQNVSALPAPGQTIVMFAPAGQVFNRSLMYHRDAFMFANKAVELPSAVEAAESITDPETGVILTFIRAFDVRTFQVVNRFDVLTATAPAYEQLATGIATS